MKKLLLLTALLIGMSLQAQDYELLAQLKKVPSQETALQLAQRIAKAAPTHYRFYKSKEFKEYNIFLVVYAPEGVTNEQIEAQKHNDNCLSVYFTSIGSQYVFDKLVANYDDSFAVWQNVFKKASTKDMKSSRIEEPNRDLLYTLSEQRPNWVIKR